MKLSIIIPVYNKKPFLQRCLNSLKPNPDVEYIIIDDKSTDGSDKLIAEFAQRSDVTLTFIERMMHAGVSVARNVGIREASGEWVTFLDADDEMSTFGIEDMITAIDTEKRALNHYPVIQFNHFRVYDDGIPRTKPQFTARPGSYPLDRLPPKWAVVWNKMYKLDFIRKNGIKFPEGQQFDEDRQFNLSCLSVFPGIWMVDYKTTTKHFDDKESLCHTMDETKLKRAIGALAAMLSPSASPEFNQLVKACIVQHLESKKFRDIFGG